MSALLTNPNQPALTANNTMIKWWLWLCALGVVYMIALGAYTRLTGSGLSIVEWKPITGIWYPVTNSAWQQEFAKYQTSPEFRLKNFDIPLHHFKQIYFTEYLHRLSGRLLGVIFLIPLIYFWIKRQLSRQACLQLGGIFLLGGLQGFLGWYMVRSGLNLHPAVSSFRLALHLIMAIVVYLLLLRMSIIINKKPIIGASPTYLYVLLGLVLGQIFVGGLVAGLDAGLTHNTFPLMDNRLIPAGLFAINPWYINFFNNPTMVQFLHRVIAASIVVYILVTYFKLRFSANLKIRLLSIALLTTTGVQFALGVLTLLRKVPLHLALAHQFFGIVLITILLFIIYTLTYEPN